MERSLRFWNMNSALLMLLARVLGLALAYWGAAKLAGMLAIPPGFSAPVWPAAGIALGALYTWGLRVWPGILIGSFFYNVEGLFAVADSIGTAWNIAVALGIGAGSALQGVVGTLLVRRLVGEHDELEEPTAIVRFLVAGGAISCLVSATLGVVLLAGSGVIPLQYAGVNWLTWWAGDAMGVMIFAPLFFTLFGGPADVWEPRRLTVTVPMILLLILVTLLFARLRNWESERVYVELVEDGEAVTRGMKRILEQQLVVNQTVASLYAASAEGSDALSQKFLHGALQRLGGALAMAWVPRITHRAREAHEREMRRGVEAGYEIREQAADGRIIRAGERMEYFPIRVIARAEQGGRLLGFDIGSEKMRAAAISRSRELRISTMTAPIKLMGSSEGADGFALMTPVYAGADVSDLSAQKNSHLLGFVVTAFRVGDVVESALSVVPDGKQLYVQLSDVSPGSMRVQLFASTGWKSPGGRALELGHIAEIRFGERVWEVRFAPGPHAYTDEAGRSGWYRHALLAGCLLVVALVGTLLLIVTARERHIALIGDAVRRVGGGGTVRIPTSTHSPLRVIEEGINDMAARIAEDQAKLQSRVRAATAELRAQKEESEAATLAKSRVLAYASHDLRQPLHALELFISNLKQQPLTYEAAKVVANVDTCVQALGELLDGLLDLSRLDAGVVRPVLQPVRVSDQWEQLRQACAEPAATKGIGLRFRASDLWLMTDPQLLHRILMNLVANAIRYTGEGGILVACRRRGGHARIEVWDTGIGIPANRTAEIFKEFVQLDNPERDRAKGLGLGLSIVERAANLLDHRLTVRSVPGRGSCFRLEIPIANAPGAVREAPVSIDRADSATFDGVTVLVVEDDVLARRALVELLRSWGCFVVEAAGAEDARGVLASGCRPDVIATDYRLPNGRDGVDFVTQSRTTLGHDVPAFIISGDTHADVMERARTARLPLLHKPVRAARLRAVLQLLLKARTPPGFDLAQVYPAR